MDTITDLRGKVANTTRAAQNLLAEKGSSKWTPSDQSKFDNFLDEIERSQSILNAAMYASGQGDAVLIRQREGLGIFLRKEAGNMTDADTRNVRNSMSTTTPSQGGYAVATQVAKEFVSLVKGYRGIREACDTIATASGADIGFPTSDGTSETGELVTQNSAASLLDPTFGTVPIPAYKFSSKIFTVPIEPFTTRMRP